MEYLDCKALSEVIEAHESAFAGLLALRVRLTDAGVDTGPLRREIAPALLGLIRSYRLAQRRYEQACAIYLASLPTNGWSGQTGGFAAERVRAVVNR